MSRCILRANDFQKALSDCAVHCRGIDGRVRGEKSTADTGSGCERGAEKNRRMDRPVERARKELIWKSRKVATPTKSRSRIWTRCKLTEEPRRATVFHSRETEGRDHSFRKRRADRNEVAARQEKLFGDPVRGRILPGLIKFLLGPARK